MDNQLPEIYIARHGETPWTITGQHTGLTDLPLTPKGEKNAQALADRMKGMAFAKVLARPYSARSSLVHWPDSDPSPKSTRTWSSGTMANMKGSGRRRSMRSVRAGNFSAM